LRWPKHGGIVVLISAVYCDPDAAVENMPAAADRVAGSDRENFLARNEPLTTRDAKHPAVGSQLSATMHLRP
jgi:hypothetical protein